MCNVKGIAFRDKHTENSNSVKKSPKSYCFLPVEHQTAKSQSKPVKHLSAELQMNDNLLRICWMCK